MRFDSLLIEYDDRVLKPRPWTAHQSHWARDLLASAPPGPVLELCTGAGQIGLLTIAATDRELVAVDLDPAACELARRNARRARLASRVEVRQGDLEEALGPHERFPLVVADPPYLGTDEHARYPDDPRLAIDGGADGMTLVWRCVAVISRHLLPGASAILQLRSSLQAGRVRERLAQDGNLALTEFRNHGRGTLALLSRA